jgi:hypothetical protein
MTSGNFGRFIELLVSLQTNQWHKPRFSYMNVAGGPTSLVVEYGKNFLIQPEQTSGGEHAPAESAQRFYTVTSVGVGKSGIGGR